MAAMRIKEMDFIFCLLRTLNLNYFSMKLNDCKIPEKTNLFLSIFSITMVMGSLYLFAHSESWWIKILAAFSFGLMNNTIFSLLHESTHGVLFTNRTWNNWGGRILAAFFPTSFTLQQAFHLGHHRRNRTDEEIFDQYYPHDNLWMKRAIIYMLLIGLYWPSSPFANLLFLFFPGIFEKKTFRKNDLMKDSSFDSMLTVFDRITLPKNKIRGEILLSLSIQVLMFWFLDLTAMTWFVCYYTFAIFWSSLQYTDHAWSKRDIREGAWNLKVSKFTEMVYLNYHYHLVHHRHPNLPWIHLPKFVQATDARPSFWSIYFKLWRGPTPIEEPNPKLSRSFEDEIYLPSEKV